MLTKGFRLVDAFYNKLSSTALFKHGFFWLATSIAFDFGTSWVMMTLRGASAEGNVPTKTLFEHPSWGSFLRLLSNQYPWVFFLCLAVAAYGLTKADLPLAKNLRYISTTLSWPLGAYRLMVGPSSNVTGMLLVYGSAASEAGYFLVFVCASILVLADFLKTLRREEQVEGTKGFGCEASLQLTLYLRVVWVLEGRIP